MSDSDSDSSSSSSDSEQEQTPQQVPMNDNESDNDSSEEEDSKNESGDEDDDQAHSEGPPAKKQKANDGSAVQATGNLKIFVQGLSFDATEDDIKEFFSDCGEIAEFDLPPHPRNSSIAHGGLAYITFSTQEGFDAACAKDGQTHLSRWLNIKPAKTFGEAKNAATERPADCTTLFIGQLSYNATEDDLNEVFVNATATRLAYDQEGNARGFGYAEFASGEDAEKAIKDCTGVKIHGRAIRLDWATSRGGGGGNQRSNGRAPDWDCPECGANVFGSKSECFKCGTPNPNPGSGGNSGRGGFRQRGGRGGGSFGGGRAPDWDCPECGANVLAANQNASSAVRPIRMAAVVLLAARRLVVAQVTGNAPGVVQMFCFQI
eukprot:GABV01000397.1.p1 GENE.GABV01000397.1~~GABV01000397.1.p1  ORF type:complete len:376 (-),score=118.70 GABV01000397.1:239-1366(-)